MGGRDLRPTRRSGSFLPDLEPFDEELIAMITKRFLSFSARLMAFGAVVALASACSSGNDEGSKSSSDALASCNSLCDAQAKGEKCTPAAADTCKQLCAAVTPSFSGDCSDKAKAYYTCAEKMKWVCSGGDLAVSTDQSCKAESDAYNAACAKKN
jgi:hypothetical protein